MVCAYWATGLFLFAGVFAILPGLRRDFKNARGEWETQRMLATWLIGALAWPILAFGILAEFWDDEQH
jgi:hypothetical protein